MSEDAKLIKLVRSHRNLYDKKSEFYEDETVKANTWRDIAAAMRKPDDEVIRRWAALRKRFIEHRKKLSYISSGAMSYPVKHWSLYKSLDFLNDHVSVRLRQITPTVGKVEPDQDDDTSSHLDPLHPLDFENIFFEKPPQEVETAANGQQPSGTSETSNSEIASASRPTTPTPSMGQYQRGFKRKLDVASTPDLGASLVDAFKAMGTYFDNLAGKIQADQPARSSIDEASMAFGRSMGLQMTLIRSPAARLRLQAQICTLMTEAFHEQENTNN